MVESKTKDTGSKDNIIGFKNVLLRKNVKSSSLGLSKKDIIQEKTEAAPYLSNGAVNSIHDLFVSKKVQAQGMNEFDCDTPKILVVDDDAGSRMLAIAVFALEGYEVIEADSGFTAVKMVAKKPPDLILLDLKMPEIDGFEVCQLLKQNEHTRLIPIIMMTALNDNSHLAPRKIDVLSTLSTKPKAPILLRKANKIYVTLLRCF